MTRRGIWLLIVLLLTAQSAQALRCGRYVIARGDHKIEVLKKCGEPTLADSWEEYRIVPVYDPYLDQYIVDQVGRTVRIDEWTYNFGRQKLMQKLLFEDGELEKIEALGYGY